MQNKQPKPVTNGNSITSDSQMNRRQFIGLTTLATFGLLAKDYLQPANASANSDPPKDRSTDSPIIREAYQLFVPRDIAKEGGNLTFTLRSGEPCNVSIPRHVREWQEIELKGVGLEGGNIFVIAHTLFDPKLRVADKLHQELDRTSSSLLQGDPTWERCERIYELLEDGKHVEDLTALEFLNYVIASSGLEPGIRQRYEIASQNARLVRIESEIEQMLATSDLSEDAKKQIRGTFQYVRASDPVPDLNFNALQTLDAIVEASSLPVVLKRVYALASAKSRAFAADFAIAQFIVNNDVLNEQKNEYLRVYKAVRDGEKIRDADKAILSNLDSLISNSDLPQSHQLIYFLARKRFFDTKGSSSDEDPIVHLIEHNQDLTEQQQKEVLDAYRQVMQPRAIANENSDEGNTKENESLEAALVLLDSILQDALDNRLIPDEYVCPYTVARKALLPARQSTGDMVYKCGKVIVPTTITLLQTGGLATIAGVPFSALTGAAATNATLAFLGGGSVAAGGLGMLGGLAVVTGGAALIGAAGLLSIALMTQMDKQAWLDLGLAGVTGTLASAGIVFIAWTGAGVLGVAGTLSGAAAISTTIAALGGLNAITGGASFIAFGVGFAVWSAIQHNRQQRALHELEVCMYILTEAPSEETIGGFVSETIPKDGYNSEEVFLAPDIPLDKLENVLRFASLEPDEKVVAVVDTSSWDDAKEGIVFTDRRIVWRAALSATQSTSYFDLADVEKAREIAKIIEKEENQERFEKFLLSISFRIFTETEKLLTQF